MGDSCIGVFLCTLHPQTHSHTVSRSADLSQRLTTLTAGFRVTIVTRKYFKTLRLTTLGPTRETSPPIVSSSWFVASSFSAISTRADNKVDTHTVLRDLFYLLGMLTNLRAGLLFTPIATLNDDHNTKGFSLLALPQLVIILHEIHLFILAP